MVDRVHDYPSTMKESRLSENSQIKHLLYNLLNLAALQTGVPKNGKLVHDGCG